MTFEGIVGKISSFLAAVIIFLMADGFYLTQKGFTMIDGNLVLVREAEAKPAPTAKEVVEGMVKPAAFTMDEYHYLGDATAPVTIYEFSSLGCSHCADFHLDTLPRLKKDYIDTGKVKLVFADFPIDQKSMKASMLARCVDKDKYFDFLGLLFKKQMSWNFSFKTDKILAGYAEMEGVTPEKAAACMSDDAVAEEIIYVRQQAMERLQIQGTPSFLIRGKAGEEMIYGVPSTYQNLKDILDKYL